MFWSKDHLNVENKLVVISGASQGLGKSLAILAFSKGADVVLIARTESKLVDAVKDVEKLRTNETQTVEYVAADLSDATEARRAINFLRRVPDVLMCCAGSSIPKLFTDLSAEELSAGVSNNYLSALYLAHAGMKAMTSVPNPDYTRHIVLFSSVLHFYSFIGYAQYAPAKSALRSLGDCIRQEGIPYNIKVAVVFAGNFESEGFYEENKTKPEITRKIEGPSKPISSEAVAAIVFKALNNGQQMITTDLIGLVLSSSMLSGSPRISIAQFFFGFLMLLFAPIIEMFVENDIKNFFKATEPIKREDADQKNR
ncbi:hypothetical protein V1511DRAFT_492520 [Dipodascopsis uninucleata]